MRKPKTIIQVKPTVHFPFVYRRFKHTILYPDFIYISMKTFNSFLEEINNLQIYQIDPEDDWEDAEQVQLIANQVGIRFSSNKDISIIAKIGDQVVGGVADVSYDDEEGRTYDFDVVVHPKFQGPQMIGIKLINAAIQNANSHDANTIRTWVVNPRLIPIMVNKFGFDGWNGRDTSAVLYKQI